MYFPAYYYDKDARTHNKEKQKRLYIGKVVEGRFIPNRKYQASPGLSRKDAGSPATAQADLSCVHARSIGATSLLKSLADKTGLTEDLASTYGKEMSPGSSCRSPCSCWLTRSRRSPCTRSGRGASGLLQMLACHPGMRAGCSGLLARTRHPSCHFFKSAPGMSVPPSISPTTARRSHRHPEASAMSARLRTRLEITVLRYL